MDVSPPIQELSRVLKSVNDNEVPSHQSHINQISIAFLPVAESIIPSLISLIQTRNELDNHYHSPAWGSRVNCLRLDAASDPEEMVDGLQ
jgi:hypothetical protein